MRKTLLFIIGVLVFIGILTYLAFDRIALYTISKACDLKITYADFKKLSIGEYSFNGLKAIDMKSGIGIVSQHAKLRPNWNIARPQDISIDFDLHNVNLIRERDGRGETYLDLPGLVSVPFTSHWVYSKISGRITRTAKGIRINSLRARSDEIRFSLSGALDYNNMLDSDMVVYFSETLLNRIPQELSGVVLNNEADNWKSLSVHLKGDLKSPSIELSSRLFRLNIKNASEGKL